MDDVFTKELFFFIVGLLAVTYFIRLAVEAAFPSLSKKTELTRGERIWQTFILPAIPIVLGGAAATLLSTYPFPEGVQASTGARFWYGIACGFVAPWVYRMIAAIAAKKWDITIPEDPRVPLAARPNETTPDSPSPGGGA